MAEKKTKILFKRSSVPDRVPSANTLDYGEIALNYASGTGKSFISLKKANSEIAQFMEKDYNDANYANKAFVDTIDANLETLRQDVIDNEEVVATAFNTFNESAGFDDGGNSTLGMSLTDAIIDLQNEWGHQGAQGPQGPKGTDLTFGAYLPISGGTMSGPLVINGILDATGSTNAGIIFQGGNIPYSFGVSSTNTSLTISTTQASPLYGYVSSAITSVSATTTKSAYTTTTTNKVYLVGTTSFSPGDGGLYKYTGVTMSANCIFATSDERLKDFYEDVGCDLDELKNIPKKYFSWKDDADKGRQIGTSAQELHKIYPEIVSIDEEGTHSVAYDRLSIVALAAIDKLYDMVKELKEENQLLKQRLDSIND